MTKEKKEQLSNRLVLNFGVLLGGALILLYVRSALSSSIAQATYIVLLVLGILGLLGSIAMFVLGKKNDTKMKNYSAIPFGVFICCAMLYLAKLSLIPSYTWRMAVGCVYIAMAVYFIVLTIVVSVQLKKPTIKPVEEAELSKKKYLKKKKKKK